jgi:hypothetical protein
MKTKLNADERYPFFSLAELGDVEADVSDETVARWKRVQSEFEVVQNEMAVICEAFYKKKNNLP